jgi:hypothetical protein
VRTQEENVIRRSRFALALGLTLALGVSGVAFGTASVNNAQVIGKVKPKKLDKKKFKPVSLQTGVLNDYGANLTGTQVNPSAENISYSKNIKFNLGKAEPCPVTLASGTPTETARQQCPADSFIGSGKAEVQTAPGTVIAEPDVNVFVGPGKNDLQLHTYSPTLGTASPVVPAKIVKSTAGAKYGQALSVPAAPETGAVLITKFEATIEKSAKVVTARCKPKKFTFLRKATYKDGTSETVKLNQPCKPKS